MEKEVYRKMLDKNIIGNYQDHAKIWDMHIGWDRTEMVNFYSSIATKYGKNILYLMSATGGLANDLSGHGFDITCIDRESNMVEIGQIRYSDNSALSFICQDVSILDLAKKDYDFCFCMDLEHLLEDETRQKVFANVSSHLKKGGCFCFPMNIPGRKSFKTKPQRFDYTISPDEDIKAIWKIGITEYNAKKSITKISQDVYIQANKNTHEFHHEFILRAYTNEEISDLLSSNGFSIKTKYADYDMSKYDGGILYIIEAVKS